MLFSTPYILCLIQECVQSSISLLAGLSGLASILTSGTGHDRAYNVNVLRCRDTVTPLGTFATPDARFDMIHLDIVGPLSPSQGYRYLLTIIDCFTRWPEAIPVADITAPTVAQAFIHTWVSRFGIPSTVTTDCEQQFESALWQHLMQTLGSTHIRTTAYHPTSNGLIERFHCQLKASLRACPDPSHWVDALLLVLLGVHTALKEDLGCSSAELVYGTTLRLPGEYFCPTQAGSVAEPLSALDIPCSNSELPLCDNNLVLKLMSAKTCTLLLMFLCTKMLCRSHCSSLTMAPTRSSATQISTSPLTSVDIVK